MKLATSARTLAAYLLVATLLPACHESPSPPSPAVGTRNLGVASMILAGSGDLWAVVVWEAEQGGRDLNGDGDSLDPVLHVYDLRTQELVNTGLATGLPPVPGAGTDDTDPLPYAHPVTDGERIAFVVSESAQGNADLNGDGDAEDGILHVFDARTRRTTNMQVAVQVYFTSGLAFGEGLLAVAVDERASGQTDVDGDGEANDIALLVYETGLAKTPSPARFLNPRRALLDTNFVIADGLIGFFARESPASGDLNGDGDVDDLAVFQLFDARRASILNSGLAASGWSQMVVAGTWSVVVSESQQGGRDLNGDGDALDLVVHTYDPRAGTVRNARLVVDSPYAALSSSELVAAPTREAAVSIDLNGDGDLEDLVPSIYDPILGTVTSTGVAVGFAFGGLNLLDGWVGLPVSEVEQGGQDLNGDGDAADIVFHVYDVRSGATVNLGIDGFASRGAGRWLLMMRGEAVANLDWNGDGDREDYVLFRWDARTMTVANTGWATGGVHDLLGDTALFGVPEAMQSRDLTGDGDLDDVVLARLDLQTATADATAVSVGIQSRLATQRNAVAMVGEYLAQEDLNGDGDLADQVLFVVDLGE